MVVQKHLLGVLLVELGTLADTQYCDECDEESHQDGSIGVENGHGDENELEGVFNRVKYVDELRGHGGLRVVIKNIVLNLEIN